MRSYKTTVYACYLGSITQAALINLTPVLFAVLLREYGLSYGALGFLVLTNFVTQVGADVAFSKAVDRHGFRPFVLAAGALSLVGLGVFATLAAAETVTVYTVPASDGYLMAKETAPVMEQVVSTVLDSENNQSHSLLAGKIWRNHYKTILEFPLPVWRDVGGSQLTLRSAPRILAEFLRLVRSFRRIRRRMICGRSSETIRKRAER